MKPAPFAYHAPERPDEVVGLLREYGEDAKLLAGGQSLVPMLSMRLAIFEHLIDIGRVAGLSGIERRDGSVRVGAMTTEASIERSKDVAEAVPLLSRVTPYIGHFQIRNRGTVGGCIAHADPAGEYPVVALALDATIETLGADGARSVHAADFFTGIWDTALAEDELVVGVTFPIWSGRCGFAVAEMARRHGDFALAGAVVGVELTDGDRIERCTIGLIGLGPTPLRATAAEAAATGNAAEELSAIELGHLATADLTSVAGDHHAPASYRIRVGATMVERAWTQAIEEARRG